MLSNHLKIGSAILNREYFWSVDCTRCKSPPEVYFRPDAGSPQQRLDARRGGGSGSHVFHLRDPGLYLLKNFCGGGFRFDADVSVTEQAIAILRLQGTAEI